MCVMANPNVADEGLPVMAGCASCFCLWLRTDELFRLQFKHLHFNIELDPLSRCLCHIATLFFRRQDKNKDSNGRTCDVRELNNNEIGAV